MTWMPIKKDPAKWILRPNLINYEKTYADFSWEVIRRELSGLPDGKGLNIAHEAIDRHADGALRDHLAVRWLGEDNTVVDFTYGGLKKQSSRFANVLKQSGVDKGDRVFILAGRIPDLYVAVLGTLKAVGIEHNFKVLLISISIRKFSSFFSELVVVSFFTICQLKERFL